MAAAFASNRDFRSASRPFIDICIFLKENVRGNNRAASSVVALMGCFRAFFIVGCAHALFKEERQTLDRHPCVTASIRTPGSALRNFNIVGLERFYDRSLS